MSRNSTRIPTAEELEAKAHEASALELQMQQSSEQSSEHIDPWSDPDQNKTDLSDKPAEHFPPPPPTPIAAFPQRYRVESTCRVMMGPDYVHFNAGQECTLEEHEAQAILRSGGRLLHLTPEVEAQEAHFAEFEEFKAWKATRG